MTIITPSGEVALLRAYSGAMMSWTWDVWVEPYGERRHPVIFAATEWTENGGSVRRRIGSVRPGHIVRDLAKLLLNRESVHISGTPGHGRFGAYGCEPWEKQLLCACCHAPDTGEPRAGYTLMAYDDATLARVFQTYGTLLDERLLALLDRISGDHPELAEDDDDSPSDALAAMEAVHGPLSPTTIDAFERGFELEMERQQRQRQAAALAAELAKQRAAARLERSMLSKLAKLRDPGVAPAKLPMLTGRELVAAIEQPPLPAGPATSTALMSLCKARRFPNVSREGVTSRGESAVLEWIVRDDADPLRATRVMAALAADPRPAASAACKTLREAALRSRAMLTDGTPLSPESYQEHWLHASLADLLPA